MVRQGKFWDNEVDQRGPNSVLSFKCPVCKRAHAVNSYEAREDFVCQNNASSQVKIFQNMENPNLFTRTVPGLNHFSTKVDDYRDVTVVKKLFNKGSGFGRAAWRNY